jgi:voltage-gated potassium channel
VTSRSTARLRPGRQLSQRAVRLLEQTYRSRLRALRLGLTAMAMLIAGGTAGYMLVEGWQLFDALYMVIITLSTVGFAETRPLSDAGRALTIALIVTGVGTFAFVAAAFSRLIVEGELRDVLGRRRMDREISALDRHVIVCGFGRVGKEVARNLVADEVPVVIVDVSEEAADAAAELNLPFVRGNAVEEEVLDSAGLDRASGLLLTLSNEADNVYVTLLAKERRRDLTIISRSITEQGERRLRAAGASRVVSPERIGALSMSNTVTRPSTVRFTEVVTTREKFDLQLEEIKLTESSALLGKSIEECNIRRNFGLIVVGILTGEEEMVFNPPPDYRLESGATLIVLGRTQDLRRFRGAA